MKSLGISVLVSGFLVSLLGIAAKVYGVHSTPGIWLAMLNLPGILFVAWINSWMGFCIAICANSLLYAGAFGIVRRFKNLGHSQL